MLTPSLLRCDATLHHLLNEVSCCTSVTVNKASTFSFFTAPLYVQALWDH